MATPTAAQTAALIDLAEHRTGDQMIGIRRSTLDALRRNGWAVQVEHDHHEITQDGFIALSTTRDGRAYLDTVWSAAHAGYARTHGPVTPHTLDSLVRQYRTMMDSAAHLDDAVHHASCDRLRARAVFVLARIATAINRQMWMHPDAILESAEDYLESVLPGVALVDELGPDTETATCIHDGRPIARKSRRVQVGDQAVYVAPPGGEAIAVRTVGEWFHIDEQGGMGCFADPIWSQVATPLPNGDEGDTREAVAVACSEPRAHTPHPWGDDNPRRRLLCAGAGTGRPVVPGSGWPRPVKVAAAALLAS
jgi:hypothetical protein